GHMPPRPSAMKFSLERVDRSLFDGKATEKEIIIRLGTNTAPEMHLLLVVPNHRTKPAPVFVGPNFCGNHTVLADPQVALPTGWMPKGCAGGTNDHATDASRGAQGDGWAMRQCIDRRCGGAACYE